MSVTTLVPHSTLLGWGEKEEGEEMGKKVGACEGRINRWFEVGAPQYLIRLAKKRRKG